MRPLAWIVLTAILAAPLLSATGGAADLCIEDTDGQVDIWLSLDLPIVPDCVHVPSGSDVVWHNIDTSYTFLVYQVSTMDCFGFHLGPGTVERKTVAYDGDGTLTVDGSSCVPTEADGSVARVEWATEHHLPDTADLVVHAD